MASIYLEVEIDDIKLDLNRVKFLHEDKEAYDAFKQCKSRIYQLMKNAKKNLLHINL